MKLIARVPEYVRSLVPYPPGKPIDEVEREYGIKGSIKLASNESPIGPSPKGVAAAEAALRGIHFYPDGSGYYLKKKLAAKTGLKPENIILGNGSNEIIELIIRAFVSPGDEVVMGRPAFIVYELITDAAGGGKRPVPLDGYTHDLAAMAAAVNERTRVVFVANPNNPTGTAVSGEALERFLSAVPDDVLVVMDEAYYEYAACHDPSFGAVGALAGMKNLIVLRTFSKAYGLAGLRAGYGLASAEVISILERVRQPFNVNSLALAAAEAALDDEAHLKKAVEVNDEGMRYLNDALKGMGLTVVDSLANFILFDAGRDGGALFEDLIRKGVIVRPMKGYGLPTHLRVTVGLPEENRRFIQALKEVL